MAYGKYSKSTFKKVFEDSRFRIYVKWKYRQDPIANETEYVVEELQISKVKSDLQFYNQTGSARAGIATLTSHRKTQSIKIDMRSATTQTFNLSNDSRVIENDDEGLPKSGVYLHWYLKANLNSPYSPEYDWHSLEITDLIPQIDRRNGTTTVTKKNVSKTSITLNLKTNFYSKVGRYRINKGGWKSFNTSADLQKSGGGEMDLTITNLNPNTSYLIEVQCKRDFNNLYNNSDMLDVKTLSFGNPTAGTLKIVDMSENSVKIEAEGWKFQAGTTWGYFQYYLNSKWNTIEGKSNVFVINNLTTNKHYDIDIRLVDNYGSVSNIVTISFDLSTSNVEIIVSYKGELWIADVIGNIDGKNYECEKIISKINGIMYS